MTPSLDLLRPMEHSGDSANIAYYRERKRDTKPDEPYVWASVLRSTIGRDPETGERITGLHSTYYVTVNHTHEGEIGEVTYRPKVDPKGSLPPRTVARLVRELMMQ